jgi:hypothetical protein
VAVGAVVALAAFLLASPWSGGPSGPRAVIVDQLSLTQPNPAFVEMATDTLERAGYTVDYYPGEGVTVDFYRNLPGRAHELLILRAHSAVPGKDLDIFSALPRATLERIVAAIEEDVLLFTSEPYVRTRYLEEQKALRLFPVRYYGDDGEASGDRYFAIAPGFVTSSMRGEFDDTIVVIAGCSGLAFDRTAAALVARGAGAVVGWSDLVSAEHTDMATERLLRHLLTDGLPLREAVALTAVEVGPDPTYGSTLELYPSGDAAFALP